MGEEEAGGWPGQSISAPPQVCTPGARRAQKRSAVFIASSGNNKGVIVSRIIVCLLSRSRDLAFFFVARQVYMHVCVCSLHSEN